MKPLVTLKKTLLAGLVLMAGSAFASLPDNIAQKLQEYRLSADSISMYVAPVGGHAPLINHLSDVPRTPASTQKLITTAIALDMLGGEFRWFTDVYHTGVVIGSVLYGDVMIVGKGDPSLTHERLQALLEHLPAKGIRHIKGDIIVDNRAFFDVAKDVNAFDGHGQRAYNAQPNALLINYGTLEIDVLPSGRAYDTGEFDKTGKPIMGFLPSDERQVAVKVSPPLAGFVAPKTLPAQGGACNGEPSFRLQSDKLIASGTARASCGRMSYWLTFADGDVFALKAIKGIWSKIDPAFIGQVRLAKPYESRPKTLPIISYPSRPLSEQVYDINQYSNNVMTEQVALTLPLSMGHAVSTYPKTFALMDDWWQTHLNSPKPIMSRASGLCRDCLVSVKAMGELLDYMASHDEFDTFKNSLPIAGQTGTMTRLAYRQSDNPAIGRAFIKTGTLDNVTSMAGYVLDTQGRWYVAVGMINAPNAGNTGAVRVLDEMLSYVAVR